MVLIKEQIGLHSVLELGRFNVQISAPGAIGSVQIDAATRRLKAHGLVLRRATNPRCAQALVGSIASAIADVGA